MVVVRVIAQSRGPVVPSPGSPRAQIRVREPLRQAAHTVPMDATTGCANPPGAVGVERRREMCPTRLPSLRFGGAPVSRAKIWGFSPRFRVSSRSGLTESESGEFVGVASFPHHLGGWRTRWLGSYRRSSPPGGPLPPAGAPEKGGDGEPTNLNHPLLNF